MLETLLSYDDAAEKSVLHLSYFKKDHGNITVEFPTATHPNRGLVERSRYFEDGKKCDTYHTSTTTLHCRSMQDATKTHQIKLALS